MYKACQAARTDGGLFRDTGVMNEVNMNDRVKMTVRLKRQLGQGAREPTRVGANKTKEERF